MRSKEEILNEKADFYSGRNSTYEKSLIEVLIDIRDLLLEKTKAKRTSRKDWEKKF